ncbi:alpha/beta hydrolase-fold protein [Luteipulveratus sp. YIM 133132]|uniref:Alpha/beta hydrolase-fold protein n=1 Tax=Luteipulveratus flavus TaxID=3031728 RepID=A0ABT6C7L8_9MICO|nr:MULTISPECIES: alpha/beta hydrolase-fold protein [unclassified Luteipulveratus]MDE9364172.1 alpha/beta hydrolase-fold protein [Luteipulveratus sp. YIM 133132]MDF8264931.1 alpha/beta hydrolase-fold protein [Luteipulveratus sp. YIM 133296]
MSDVDGQRVDLPVPGRDVSLGVIRHGHFGRPVLVFPSEGGRAEDFAAHGMTDAVRDLLDQGRVSFFCVDSADQHTWSDNSLTTEERAHGHQVYTRWLEESVLPWIHQQLGGRQEIATLGVSMGAYHAVHFALTHADVAPLAMGLSGNYDVTSWHGWGERGEATYFANPTDYVAGMHGGHLDWIRSRVGVLLVVGQGAFETHPTGALPSSRAFAALLGSKGIPHQLDLWGEDVAHDWPWWQRQLAHHLPRFC